MNILADTCASVNSLTEEDKALADKIYASS